MTVPAGAHFINTSGTGSGGKPIITIVTTGGTTLSSQLSGQTMVSSLTNTATTPAFTRPIVVSSATGQTIQGISDASLEAAGIEAAEAAEAIMPPQVDGTVDIIADEPSSQNVTSDHVYSTQDISAEMQVGD